MNGVLTANTRETRNIIIALLAANKAFILIGHPGIGKSDILYQAATQTGRSTLIFEGPSLDPTDPRGVLVPTGRNSVFTRSAMLPDPEKNGAKGLLIVDELLSGLPATQTALHSLFHPTERRLGTDRLPDGWLPVATGNLASDHAGSFALLTALSDRIGIIKVSENFQVWKADYALPRKIHPVVIGYLNKWRGDHFSTFETRIKGEDGKGFASPRSWVDISDILYSGIGHLTENEMTILAAAYLGQAVASSFIAYKKTSDSLPDMDHVYRTRTLPAVPSDPSLQHAICSAMVAKLNDLPKDVDKGGAIKHFFDYSLKIPSEFAVVMAIDALVLHEKDIKGTPGWSAFTKKHGDLII